MMYLAEADMNLCDGCALEPVRRRPVVKLHGTVLSVWPPCLASPVAIPDRNPTAVARSCPVSGRTAGKGKWFPG